MGVIIERDDVGPPVADDEGWAAEAVARHPGWFDLWITRNGMTYVCGTYKTKKEAEDEAVRLSSLGTFEVKEV